MRRLLGFSREWFSMLTARLLQHFRRILVESSSAAARAGAIRVRRVSIAVMPPRRSPPSKHVLALVCRAAWRRAAWHPADQDRGV